MIETTPIYISPKGGSIVCFRTPTRRVLQSCSFKHCIYTRDLYKAKDKLDSIESSHNDHENFLKDVVEQRKSTLKWNQDSELSAIDKTRIISRLAHAELAKCDI